MINKILKKKKKDKIICLTAYSKNLASIIDNYCDIILVGDSLANVVYGMSHTHKITLSTIIQHAQSVRKGTKKSLLVVDMPKGSYDNVAKAVKNAKIIKKKTKCDAVKIESNKKNFNIIETLVKKNIPVMGHIGFTPQFKKRFKIQRNTKKSKNKLLEEAKKIEKAGAFSVVLECISSQAAKEITQHLKIPTIGIGSSSNCDGQILVTDDLIGLSGFYPKFVKKYCDINKIVSKAVKRYRNDVKKKLFPSQNNSF